ncbi:hypothetical protein [Nocardia sp. CA-290969]|uniref:hypothetical protein n=1 Tax=Nocardia sp. CA-290969 TaxID=3239986 RepID=UPI003D921FB8
MFEPPEGSADFAADADKAEAADTPRPQDTLSPEEEAAALEEQVARLQERLDERKAALARRDDQPQVIDSSGAAVDLTTEEEPEWPHLVIELHGKRVEVKAPPAAAVRYLGVFGFGEAGVGRGDFQDFMNRHVSPRSVQQIKEWTYAGEIDENFYDDLMKRIMTLGTNRPTGPRRSSPRSR